MKKFFSILVASFSLVSAYCMNYITRVITLYESSDEISNKGNQILSPIRAIQEGNMVRISSDKESNAHVRITDSDGVVVRDEYIDLSQQENIVTLPDGNESKEYMIEIEFEDTYMYGFINNN